jgi:hypothetical protein
MLGRRLFVFAVPLLIGAPLFVMGQPLGRGPGRGGAGRMYDPRTVETVAGEITAVEKIASTRGMSRGVHISLRTDKGETLSVHLGPEWYVERQACTLKQGDNVQVRGSRITVLGKPAIIAAEVTKDGQTLHLRNDNGVPAWAGGWRRGP